MDAVTVYDITQAIEQFAPLENQESWDNAGLQVGNFNQEVTSVLIALDVTEEILAEAIAKKCNLILSHHPLLFGGLKRVIGKSYVERCIATAIKNDISIYSAHTNIDKIICGVNYRIAQKLNLKNVKFLDSNDSDTTVGLGVVGDLENPVEPILFLQNVKKTFLCGIIRHTDVSAFPKISRIAVCGGSGTECIDNAKREKAQLFLSADFKYHNFFDAENQIILADFGHFESEQFTKEIFKEQILKKFPNFAVHYAETNTNPIKYL